MGWERRDGVALTKHRQQTCVVDCPPLQRIGIAPKWTFMMTIMQQDPTYRRGDVVLVLFPHSNLRTAKPRPALVIQADELQTGLPQLIVTILIKNKCAMLAPTHALLIHVPVAIFYRNHHSCFYRLAFLMILEGQGHPGAVNNNPSVPDFHV